MYLLPALAFSVKFCDSSFLTWQLNEMYLSCGGKEAVWEPWSSKQLSVSTTPLREWTQC